ncbi:NTP transferase domain-containing protein [Halorarum halobium]|uniref:NTP transferase domain-containing protein n=1 Tax=Halorarum halobium TaxID=3075121 RepID=UPI003CCD1BF1
MCGGRGTRLDADAEKPLFEVGGRPMVDRVLDALADGRVETTHAVVSPHAPRTRDHIDRIAAGADADCSIIDAPGEGYVADLGDALERVERPVLTVAADLPLLDGDAVDAVLREFAGDSLAVRVPVAAKRALGVSVDARLTDGDRDLLPAGVNVVAAGDEEDAFTTDDVRFTVNVNRRRDARVAEALL